MLDLAEVWTASVNLVFSVSNVLYRTSSSSVNSSMLVTISVKFKLILSTALLVWSDNFLISSATTTKPLPASPALAASIEAFKARRLICFALHLMI